MKSLQGSDIETYANQLFRFWKLGEEKKNNGVLLLVAPAEHKVRIEVGYGLEGTLTDALSSVIITSAITPRFKANDFSAGIERGVDGIIAVLTTDAAEWHRKAKVRSDDPTAAFGALFPALLLVVVIFFIWYLIHNANGPPGRGGRSVFVPYGGSWGSGDRGAAAAAAAGSTAVFFRRGRLVGWRRRVGELVMLTKEDHAAIAAAISAAEHHTSAQIVCVLARASSRYAHVPIMWASLLALLAPWPLIYFTPWSVQQIFLVQLAVFLVAGLLFSWMPLRFALVPRAVRRARAHRTALEQFVIRRVAHTKNRMGVLIFVSLGERYARIIADEGLAQKVH